MQKSVLNCFLNVDFNEVLVIHPNGFLTCPRTESLLLWKLISVMISIQLLTASTPSSKQMMQNMEFQGLFKSFEFFGNLTSRETHFAKSREHVRSPKAEKMPSIVC